jgi:uncharacterized repeat protein (TIGR03803 family)
MRIDIPLGRRARTNRSEAKRRSARLCLERLENRLTPSFTLSSLASFNLGNGENPLIRDSSGNFFGTTDGGLHGTVFELPAGSHTIKTLVSFNNANGDKPRGALIRDTNGNLYGITSGGGQFGDGTVFELPAGSFVIKTLASFSIIDLNGYHPTALIRDSSGNFFGTTQAGGTFGLGTVFELPAGSHTIKALASFDGSGAEGKNPSGLIRDSHGNLFGTAASGGASNDGTVFELPAGSNTIRALASFHGFDGASPLAGVIRDSSGNLFGTVELGGLFGEGAVFKLPAGSHSIVRLASFNRTNGERPRGALIEDSSGNFFGTTSEGTSFNDGTVFELPAGSHTIKTLATFDGTKGAKPFAGLVRDSKGNLYGTTTAGGNNGVGTVFEVSPSTAAAARELNSLTPTTVDSFFASTFDHRRTRFPRMAPQTRLSPVVGH